MQNSINVNNEFKKLTQALHIILGMDELSEADKKLVEETLKKTQTNTQAQGATMTNSLTNNQTICVEAWEHGTGKPQFFIIENFPLAIPEDFDKDLDAVWAFINDEGYRLEDINDIEIHSQPLQTQYQVIELHA